MLDGQVAKITSLADFTGESFNLVFLTKGINEVTSLVAPACRKNPAQEWGRWNAEAGCSRIKLS